MQKRILDIAYDVINKANKKVTFDKLWGEVSSEMTIKKGDEALKMSEFYTQITFSKLFINMGDNTWDLRERHDYGKVHISMNDIYTELEKDREDDFSEEDYDKRVKAKKSI